MAFYHFDTLVALQFLLEFLLLILLTRKMIVKLFQQWFPHR